MSARRARRRSGRPGAAPIRVESSVGTIELLADPRRPAGRTLLIDGLRHGSIDLEDPSHLELDYVARIGAALDVLLPRGAPADVLHLGGGTFTLPRYLASTRPQVRQTVAERSGAVVRLAEQHLRLRRSERLVVRIEDGARTVERASDASFDLVLGDAFVGTDIPAEMTTPTFALEVARVLRDDGRFLLNVVDAPPWPLAAHQAQVLRARFAHVLAFGGRAVVRGRRSGNLLLLASYAALPRAELEQRLAGGAHPAEIVDAERIAGWS